MPDADGIKEAKMFHCDMPQETQGFFLKGSSSLDWGMKNRLSRIFNPKSGRTVMLAIDHGYFQGPDHRTEPVVSTFSPGA
jgi:putative autoinducer-2 (AI-2) aldolase